MYTARQHQHFGERCGNSARDMRQQQIETVALNEIRTYSAEGGTAPEYQDTSENTAAELTAYCEFLAEFGDFLTGENPVVQKDRRPVTTPFLQTGRG